MYPRYVDIVMFRTYVGADIPKEMVEPLEETRSELIFATEPLLASLALSVPNSNHRSPIVELDEVEVISSNPPLIEIEHTLIRSRKAFYSYVKAYHSCTRLHD